jgi:NitT/TauT family transport system permease protein
MASRAADPGAADGGRAVAAALAMAAAALVALLLHILVSDQQNLPRTWMNDLEIWRHPYPVVLETLLAAALLMLAAQWVWRPLQPSVRHGAPLLAGAILYCGLWDLLTQKLNWMALPLFPGPDLVFGSMVEDWRLLLESTRQSLQLVLSGYAVGVAAGLVSGVLIGWYPRVRYWGMPALKLVGPIPATALIPLVMILSKESYIPAAALIGFAVWFPVTMLTSSGIASVRLSYLDVARTLGAGRWYLIFHVAIPAALPHIFIGLFMGLGASFLTLIVAEAVGVQSGLGWYLKMQQGYMEYAHMFGAIIIMAVFFSGLMTLLFLARDRVLKWQKGVIKW